MESKRIEPFGSDPRRLAAAAEIIGGPYNAARMMHGWSITLAAMFSDPLGSPAALLAMMLMLGGSVWVFAALVRRETSHRRHLALVEWASAHGMKAAKASSHPEAMSAFSSLLTSNAHNDCVIVGENLSIAQVRIVGSQPTSVVPQWNLLARRLQSPWPPSGLRPTIHTASVVDLFSLSSFPSLGSAERFVIFGTDSLAASALAESSAPALLPPDIGLVLHGPYMILDFTTRPFDEIELGRMVALAEQLAPRLVFARA